MPKGDHISLMADEVEEAMETSGVNFKTAFAWAAHRRNLFQSTHRQQYNDWFGLVDRRIKARKRSRELHQFLATPPAPVISTDDWPPTIPWGHEVEENLTFADNDHYLHPSGVAAPAPPDL